MDISFRNQCKIMVLFPKFYTDLCFKKTVLNPLANGNIQVLSKANFIFKDFSRQSCIFKYFSSLCKPWPFSQLNKPPDTSVIKTRGPAALDRSPEEIMFGSVVKEEIFLFLTLVAMFFGKAEQFAHF